MASMWDHVVHGVAETLIWTKEGLIVNTAVKIIAESSSLVFFFFASLTRRCQPPLQIEKNGHNGVNNQSDRYVR